MNELRERRKLRYLASRFEALKGLQIASFGLFLFCLGSGMLRMAWEHGRDVPLTAGWLVGFALLFLLMFTAGVGEILAPLYYRRYGSVAPDRRRLAAHLLTLTPWLLPLWVLIAAATLRLISIGVMLLVCTAMAAVVVLVAVTWLHGATPRELFTAAWFGLVGTVWYLVPGLPAHGVPQTSNYFIRAGVATGWACAALGAAWLVGGLLDHAVLVRLLRSTASGVQRHAGEVKATEGTASA
jgi:hypothetical protein